MMDIYSFLLQVGLLSCNFSRETWKDENKLHFDQGQSQIIRLISTHT